MTDAAPLVRLHEDDDVVAVQKPSGEPVIPAREGSAQDCVQRRLERQLGRRLWVVHRIDKDASGVVVFALNAEAHRALSLAFEHRQVSKTYAAFVAGSIEPPQGRLDVPLHPARKGKTRPARPGEPGAQPAETEYATRNRWTLAADFVSLLEAHPHTGRHHQIRVHLRAAGVPILFDPLYARGLTPEALAGAPCTRLALHARRIDLPAPRGEGRLVIEAPLAPDLAALAEWLDARGQGEPSGA
ncbi:MAG TPA: RluA family pseudouridine synthase [Vicinamibacteria bacterium]|nr:RluA family pseudouridine synthase [Vicinamibacteria bacterium]